MGQVELGTGALLRTWRAWCTGARWDAKPLVESSALGPAGVPRSGGASAEREGRGRAVVGTVDRSVGRASPRGCGHGIGREAVEADRGGDTPYRAVHAWCGETRGADRRGVGCARGVPGCRGPAPVHRGIVGSPGHRRATPGRRGRDGGDRSPPWSRGLGRAGLHPPHGLGPEGLCWHGSMADRDLMAPCSPGKTNGPPDIGHWCPQRWE